MSVRISTLVVLLLGFAAGYVQAAEQQQAPPKPATAPAAQPAAAAKDDAAQKAEILGSSQWRRAMFEFNEWLTAQPFYTPQQVQQIKQRFNERVAKMTAEELGYMLADMETKFQIIDTPEAREARSWMAQYLSVLSDKKRSEVLKAMPNLATMTAAQLNAEIAKIEAKRATLDDKQAAFQRGQAQQVANQLQTDRTSQQNYVRAYNTAPATYSPYHSSSDVNKRLNNTPTGSGMGMWVGPGGGVGFSLPMSSF